MTCEARLQAAGTSRKNENGLATIDGACPQCCHTKELI